MSRIALVFFTGVYILCLLDVLIYTAFISSSFKRLTLPLMLSWFEVPLLFCRYKFLGLESDPKGQNNFLEISSFDFPFVHFTSIYHFD